MSIDRFFFFKNNELQRRLALDRDNEIQVIIQIVDFPLLVCCSMLRHCLQASVIVFILFLQELRIANSQLTENVRALESELANTQVHCTIWIYC